MPDETFVRPAGEDELPIVLCAVPGGAWTPGPCVMIEAGNVIEMTEPELVWLLEDGGPRVLRALRDLGAS